MQQPVAAEQMAARRQHAGPSLTTAMIGFLRPHGMEASSASRASGEPLDGRFS